MLCQGMFQEADNNRSLTLMSSPVLQKSFIVKGVDRCNEISVVTPGKFWVSNGGGLEYYGDMKPVKLISTDTDGNTLDQITDARSYLLGFHTISNNRDLIYIADNGNINKLSYDMKTKTTLITKADWTPCCVFCSKSSGDVLVGMFINVPNQNFRIDSALRGTVTGKVSRYDKFGRFIHNIKYDLAGERLFVIPQFITENKNGDVVVSGGHRLVVTDNTGKYRFSYRGHPFGKVLLPYGVCTDALSNILLCDGRTHTVQMIDKDGKFLSFLLTWKSPGITDPRCLSYDVKTNFLWVGAIDQNTVSVYKYISGRSTSRLQFDNDYL